MGVEDEEEEEEEDVEEDDPTSESGIWGWRSALGVEVRSRRTSKIWRVPS